MRAATSTERGNPRCERDIHIMPVQPRPVATPCAARPSRSEAKLLLIQAIARETYYCNMTKARLTPRDARPRLPAAPPAAANAYDASCGGRE